ncbi:MAG: ABC transporter substrate-binding protein, partial [Treponema sp.]|nr:ABC transporter substrate-binding protein [Treponema sp.]
MKRVSVIVAACLVVAMLAGCSGSKARDPDTLIIAAIGGPASLDPALTNDSASSEIMKQVYDTLFVLDFQTNAPLPSIAERFQFENDNMGRPIYLRLFLKNGVKFHNGEELTASDVKFTLDRASESPHIDHIVNQVQGTQVIGPYEVLITLKEPFAPILNNLAHTAMSIVNEKAVREGGDSYAQNPIGSGPMKLVRWVVGDRIELTRWDGYWGPAPRIKNITVRYIADMMTQLLSLETGEVDMVLTLQPQNIRRVEENPDLQLIRQPSFSMNYIGFNMQRKPFDDIRVRQAIAHAVDMDALVRTVWPNVGRPGRGPIGSLVWASAADILPKVEYNPELSRQLLAEAGLPNGFSTFIVLNQNSERIASAEILQDMLDQVGIRMDIRIMEWAAFLDFTERGDHDMYILGWVTVTADPDYGL